MCVDKKITMNQFIKIKSIEKQTHETRAHTARHILFVKLARNSNISAIVKFYAQHMIYLFVLWLLKILLLLRLLLLLLLFLFFISSNIHNSHSPYQIHALVPTRFFYDSLFHLLHLMLSLEILVEVKSKKKAFNFISFVALRFGVIVCISQRKSHQIF